MRNITIGFVVGVFGLKGEIKVKPTADTASLFKKSLKAAFIAKNGDEKILTVKSARFHKDLWLMGIEGVDTPEMAIKYKGYRLAVSENLLPPPGKDEVYWIDIDGSKVVDLDGVPVGVLKDYVETGAHDVFEITGDDGVEYMISNNPGHVKSIDTGKKVIVIDRIGLVAES